MNGDKTLKLPDDEELLKITRLAYRRGWTDRDALQEQMIEYARPIWDSVNTCSCIIAEIRGVFKTASGHLAREAIKRLATILAEASAELDLNLARARYLFGPSADRLVKNSDIITNYYEAAREFYSTGSGELLQKLLNQQGMIHQEFGELRAEFGPGARLKPVIENQWLFGEARRIKSEQGATWKEVVNILRARWKTSAYEDWQAMQVKALFGMHTLRAANYLRTGASRLKRRE